MSTNTTNNTTEAATVAAYIPESVATATAEAQRKGAQNHEDALRVLESEPVREVLRKFDGKQINKRLFDALAVACCDTPHDYKFGGHSYGELSSVKLDGHAFDVNNRRSASGSCLSVDQPEFRREYVNSRGEKYHVIMTLVCRTDDFKRLDTAATLDDFEKRTANSRRFIRQDFMAADAMPEAVRRVNEIAEKARELLDFCEVATKSEEEKTYNGSISVLCELSDKIYEAISSFKYDAETRHGKEGR